MYKLTSDMKGVNFRASLLRCIRHSVPMGPNKYPVKTVVASRVLISKVSLHVVILVIFS